MNIARYLWPYILLLLLILGGWFSVLLFEQTGFKIVESSGTPARSLEVREGQSLHYSNGSVAYKLSYDEAAFYPDGTWQATQPRLDAYSEKAVSFQLTAPLLSSSSRDEWSFSEGASLQDEQNNRQLEAAVIGINIRTRSINMDTNAQLRQEDLTLNADKIRLQSVDKTEQRIDAYGFPVTFQRRDMSGAARELHFATATDELALSGDAQLEDKAQQRQLRAHEIFIEDNIINMHSDAELQQQDIQLNADLIQLIRDEESWTIRANSSPLVFKQQRFRSAARELHHPDRTDNISLQHNTILLNESRHIKAENIVETGKEIDMHENVELKQEGLSIRGNHIHRIDTDGSIGQLQAYGTPLQLRQAGLDVNASALTYKGGTFVITGDPLHFSHKEQSARLWGTGTSLIRNPNDNLLLLHGAPARIFYDDETLQLRGAGATVEGNTAERTLSLYGIPAQLEKMQEEPFRARAQEVNVTARQIVLNKDIHIQEQNRNITAQYAIYDIAQGNWQLTGQQNVNTTAQDYIEIIVPTE